MNLDLFVQNLVKEITQTVSLSKFLPSIEKNFSPLFIQ